MFNPYGKKNPLSEIEDTTIRNLSANVDFIEALKSEVGKVLFADLIKLLDEKFKLIYEESASERDKAIFSACKYIGGRWNKIISRYEKDARTLKEVREIKNRKVVG